MPATIVKSFTTPSQAERFFACPGSVKAQEKVNIIPQSNPAAIEGTAIHELAAMCLKKKKPADDFLGEILEVKYEGDSYEFEVTDDFVYAVNLYRNTILDILKESGVEESALQVELYDKLADVTAKGKPYGGTCDCRFIAGSTLHVIDLKGGRGIIVDPTENKQCMSYAIRPVEQAGMFIDKVVLWIIQPRAKEGDYVKKWETTPERILEFKEELKLALKEAENPSAGFQQGKHCTFCLAAGDCPALSGALIRTVKPALPDLHKYLPPVKSLTAEQIGKVLPALEILNIWMGALEEYALTLLKSGSDVPNYCLIKGRKNRVWRDEGAAIDFLTGKLPEKKFMTEPKLMTPAQVEKSLKDKTIIEDFVTTPEGEFKIALTKEVKDFIKRNAEDVFKNIELE